MEGTGRDSSPVEEGRLLVAGPPRQYGTLCILSQGEMPGQAYIRCSTLRLCVSSGIRNGRGNTYKCDGCTHEHTRVRTQTYTHPQHVLLIAIACSPAHRNRHIYLDAYRHILFSFLKYQRKSTRLSAHAYMPLVSVQTHTHPYTYTLAPQPTPHHTHRYTHRRRVFTPLKTRGNNSFRRKT